MVRVTDLSAIAASRKREQRMESLLSAVAEQGRMSLSDIVNLSGVSAATIRRDLADLEQVGLLHRTHGGVMAVQPSGPAPLTSRGRGTRHDRAIGALAADLAPPSPHAVAVGGGSLGLHLVRALASRPDIMVVTNSVPAAEDAARAGVRVILAGGVVHPETLELAGAIAESTFSAVSMTLAFIPARSVEPTRGVSADDEQHAAMARAMMAHAQRVVALIPGPGVGREDGTQIGPLSLVHDIVTDARANPDVVAALRADGVRVHVAG